MSKLQNIKAIQQLLDGNHKMQTNKSFSFDVNKKQEKREVGDTWEEVDPKTGDVYTWEQKAGYRVRHGKLDAVRQALNELKMPSACPNCKNEMKNNRYNQKMWLVHKMCFDCVIDMEAKLRYEGKFEEYARNIMYNNALAWFKDADKEVEILKEALAKESLEYVNADGKVEKWAQTDRETWLKKIDEDYVKFKEDLLKNLSSKETNEQ
jgi:hypothetical protein